ncbi:MAG: tetratricopeptide repeat protein [Gemmataceae bacterium]|nr:tetratricopeptide repeat protein [Gemmataceae bacterium]
MPLRLFRQGEYNHSLERTERLSTYPNTTNRVSPMAKESVESLSQKAQQALAAGDNEQARRLYLQALSLRSDSPDVHYGLATVCFLLNDMTGAAHHFKEVTRLDPLRASAHINLGAVYNRLGQLDDAIPVLRRGIQIDNSRAEGYYNLGLAYRRKGQLDLAIQAYREATRVNPRMSDAHFNLANLYMEKEQFNLAVAHYRHALELRPDWDKALRSLAQAEAALAPQDPLREPPASPTSSTTPLSLDPSRLVDPQVHGNLLNTLHKATIDSETHGRTVLKVLETEVEPAIKELSSCLLYPDSTASELDDCVQKFENALASVRSAQRELQQSMERVRTTGEQLLKS